MLVIPLGHLGYSVDLDVARSVPDHEVAARWDGIHEPADNPVRIVGVGYEVQNAQQQDGDWLAEVECAFRFAQDCLGVPQVGMYIGTAALWGAGEQRPGMCQ